MTDSDRALPRRTLGHDDVVRIATEASGVGVWVWIPEGDHVTWENDVPYELFGIPRTDPPITAARFVTEFLHGDDLPNWNAHVIAAVRNGERFEFEGRIRRRSDGALRWAHFTGRVRRTGPDAPARVVGTVIDITGRREVESELAETRRRLDATLLDAEVATWQWDVRNDRVYGDANLHERFALAADRADGAPVATFLGSVHPADLARVQACIATAIASGDAYEASYRVMQQDGGVRHVIARGRLERLPTGEPAWLRGVIVDVTREREAEARLRRSEERYRTLFESMDEGVCLIEMIFDAAGRPADYRFVETNPAFEKQSGLVDADGRTARELVPDLEPHWIETYARIARTGVAERFVSGSAPMGRWFDVYAGRVGGPGSTQVVILFNDITARKHAEDELRTAAAELLAANRRKTEFIATLAHELRNPLAPIRNGLQLMRLAADQPIVVGKARDMMERQLDHLVHLVNDLLDIARITRGQVALRRERIVLADVVRSAIETSLPAIEAMRHQLEIALPDEPLVLDADPTRLAQVIANLLSNAAKYTPDGGRIAVRAHRDGDDAVVAVEDTGMGIPADELESVFEMFNQVDRNMNRSQGGLGIGLSLVRQLTALHGGTATATSAGPGRGSTFFVRLPLAVAQPPGSMSLADAALDDTAVGSPQTAPARSGSRLRILVVDDNRDAAESLSLLLQLRGHATAVAHDGPSGIEAARGLRPDLVFLDIGMPGMDGYAVARAIREVDGMTRTPIVALSGWGAPDDLRRSRAAGFDDHLTKPALLEAVDRVLAHLGTLRWSRGRR